MHVRHANLFDEPFSVFAVNFRLQHVRNVEQGTRPSRVQVRRRYAVRVFDGHGIVGERYHFPSMPDVKVV